MSDLSTVRGYIPEIQRKNMDVLLLNIHESPGREVLDRFDFEFSPTYLVYQGDGAEVFRSNDLPDVADILDVADES